MVFVFTGELKSAKTVAYYFEMYKRPTVSWWASLTVSCVFSNPAPSPTLDIVSIFSDNRRQAHSRNRSESRCPGHAERHHAHARRAEAS